MISEKQFLNDWANIAWDIQDACNLNAVIHTFSKFLKQCTQRGYTSDKKLTHPITLVFVDKITQLTGQQKSSSKWDDPTNLAIQWVHKRTLRDEV